MIIHDPDGWPNLMLANLQYVQYIFAVYKYCYRRLVLLRSVSEKISIFRSVLITTTEKMIFVFLG